MNRKLSQLNSLTSIPGDALIYVVTSAGSFKTTKDEFLAGIGGGSQTLDQTLANGNETDKEIIFNTSIQKAFISQNIEGQGLYSLWFWSEKLRYITPLGFEGTVASEEYVDNKVTGLLDLRGYYDASVNAFPTTGGSGASGAILKGDLWIVSVAGTLAGVDVAIGGSFMALIDNPSSDSDWDIGGSNLSYVSEDIANKGIANGYTPLDSSAKIATSFLSNCINVLLTGISFVTNSTITAGDSILVGLGKLQAQITWILSNYRRTFIKDFTTTSIVGVASETILKTIHIPAGTLKNNNIYFADFDLSKSSSAAVETILYINTTASKTGATQLGRYISATNLYYNFTRKFNINSGIFKMFSSPTNSQISNVNVVGGAAMTTFAINVNVDYYLILTTINTDTTTSAVCENFNLYE